MKRNLNFDLIRSIAIFFVICIHSGGYVSDVHLQGFSYWGEVIFHSWEILIASAVPLFIMLSGALLLGERIAPPISFLKHRLSRVLIPFFVWSVILFTLSSFKEHWPINLELLPKFIVMTLTTGVIGIYWFVYLIIGLYLITPIIKPYFCSANKENMVYLCILLFVFYFISSYFGEVKWVKGFGFGYFVYVLYYVFGYVLVNYLKDWKYFSNLAVLILFLSFLGQVYINMRHIEQNCPFQLLFNMSLFGCLLLPSMRNNRTSLLIVFLSKTSYGVYLTHAVIISGLCMVGFEHWLPLIIEPIAMASVVFAIEIVMMYVIIKLKLSKWLN